MNAKRIAGIAMFSAVALIVFMIENLFPPLFAFAPGAKLGVGTAVVLVAMITLGVGDAFVVQIVRCTLGCVFAGNPFAIVYSLPAGLMSLALQAILYMAFCPRLSIMSISLLGAIMHNVVQLCIATIVAHANMFLLLAPMLIASIIAGLAVGFIAYLSIKLMPESLFSSTKPKKENKA